MIPKISLFFWVSSILGIILLQPKIELPLMHYQLLMILHSILLGAVLIPLLQQFSRHVFFQKISWTLIISGLFIILIGFLVVPRTAMIKDGGLFITTGIILSLAPHLIHPLTVLFWPSIALIETCLLGYKLGGSLDRISVDPIPFSILSTHAATGLFLALPPMIFLSRLKGEKENRQKVSAYLSSVFFALGVFTSFYLYQLPTPTKLPILLIFVFSTWGTFFLATKQNKILPTLITLITAIIIYLKPDMHFEGRTIGLIFFSFTLLLAILVWETESTLYLILAALGSLAILGGLFFQNHIMTLCGGLVQIGLVLKHFTNMRVWKDKRDPT